MKTKLKHMLFSLLSLVVSLVLASASAQVQTTLFPTKLTPGDLRPSALFGFITASSQQVLAVGAPLQGSVYVYIRNGSNWVPDTEISDFGLGAGVAVDGSTLALSSPRGVLIYARRNGIWTQRAQLTANDFASLNGAITINRNRVAVASNGAVYVFEQDELTLTWAQTARLTGSPGAGFGTNLSLNDNTLVISEPFLNNGEGAAHVYIRLGGTWVPQATLTPNDPTAATQFGLGVSVNGGTIAVGAPGAGPGEDLGGAAYVFVNSNGLWIQQAKLESPSIDPGQDFGTSLALIGNTLLVGAYENNSEIGTAHVFVRNGNIWSLAFNLFPDDGVPSQRFANNVTMPDANTYVCGSPTATVAGKFNAGAVYFFTT